MQVPLKRCIVPFLDSVVELELLPRQNSSIDEMFGTRPGSIPDQLMFTFFFGLTHDLKLDSMRGFVHPDAHAGNIFRHYAEDTFVFADFGSSHSSRATTSSTGKRWKENFRGILARLHEHCTLKGTVAPWLCPYWFQCRTCSAFAQALLTLQSTCEEHQEAVEYFNCTEAFVLQAAKSTMTLTDYVDV